MKFNEKLTKLRKKEGMSQEELGEKLNVTRQTVSKWELGQTFPEMEKNIEIGKIFNVDLNALLNEETELDSNNEQEIMCEDLEKTKERVTKYEFNFTIILLIIIAILLVFIIVIICNEKNYVLDSDKASYNNEKSNNDIIDDVDLYGDIGKNDNQLNVNEDKEEYKSGVLNNHFSNIEKDVFNNSFNMYTGTTVGYFTNSVIDLVINNNQTNSRKISISYLNTVTQEVNEIKNIKKKINDSQKYNIYFEYDKYGYIYMMKIENN